MGRKNARYQVMSDSSNDFHYWAFISYSSKDAAVARRLHKKLETYGIPKDLRGRPGRDEPVPRKLFPIFRDRDELPLSADLGGTLQDALRKSRFLIVVCSPKAAGSKWVNEEIRYFKSLGRENRVIAVIVGGENAKGERASSSECFPPALCHRVDREGQITGERISPIAGDLRKGGDGWTRTFLKCVAGISGLGFDAFIKRERRRARRRRLALAVVAMHGLAAGVWAWDYNRIKVSYFAEVVERRGVPVGVIPLTEEQVSHRERSLRFESSRRRVRKVTEVDSRGNPRRSERFAPVEASWAEIEYRENGSVEVHRLFRRDGLELLRRVYSEDLTVVEFKDPSGHAAQALTGGSSALERHGIKRWDDDDDWVTKTEITRWVQTYDEKGFVAERLFQNAWGAPRSDDGGVFGLRYKRREDGQLKSEITLGADGGPLEAKSGELSELRHRYNDAGYLVEVSLHDRAGKLVKGESGFAIEAIEWDEWGNDKRRTYLDENRDPVLRMTGFSSFVADYDTDGFLSEQRYYGINDEPVSLTTGDAHATRFLFDESGNLVKRTQWDEQGGPALHKSGFHSSERRYDKHHRLREVAYFGTNGEAVTVANQGFHRLTRDYDERGYISEETYWGTDDEAVTGSQGWHRRVLEHDKRGLQRLERLYSPEGPTTGEMGVHEVRTRYDDRGNEAGQSFFNENGDPAFSTDLGCHEVRFEVDERGHPREQTLFGPNGRKIQPNGFHRMVWVGDDEGNVEELRFYDINAQEAYEVGGVHRSVFRYNPQGLVESVKFFGVDGPIRSISTGSHEIRREYDIRGNMTMEAFFDEEGQEALTQDGYHKAVGRFDRFGNVLEEFYFGLNDRPIEWQDWGAHRRVARYDDLQQLVEEKFYGTDNKPVIGVGGHHHAVAQIGGQRRIVGWKYYDGDGNKALTTYGVHHLERKLDPWGRTIEERYYGLMEEPVYDKNERAHWKKRSFDAKGNKTHEWLLDENGDPTVNAHGYHLRKAEFDNAGRRRVVAYFGVDNNEVRSLQNGLHRIERDYNALGKITREAYFDVDGSRMNDEDGIHESRRTWDSRGTQLTQEYYDRNLKLTLNPHRGAARWVNLADERGRIVETRYYDVDRQATLDIRGRHLVKVVFGPQGKINEVAYCDVKDDPVNDLRDKIAKTKRRFNQAGLVVEETYYGADGRRAIHREGFSRAEQDYNNRGQVSAVRFYDVDDNLLEVNGEARREIDYDLQTGEITEVRAYSATGERVR